MIRFVDLRYQGVGARFAFWDTVRDRFEIWLGFQAWDTWAAFEGDCVLGFPREGESVKTALARRRALCPPWVFEPATDEELGFRDGGGVAEGEELQLLREVERTQILLRSWVTTDEQNTRYEDHQGALQNLADFRARQKDAGRG